MMFLYVFLSLFLVFNLNATELDSVIIEENSIENNETVKTIKKEDDKSVKDTIETQTTTFIRKSGGVGSKILFYIDSSTSSQVSLSIEGFDYTTPSLASFTPAALHFGVFDKIEINKDNSFASDNTTAHSANINFTFSDKNYISLQSGSFGTFGISSNNHIKISEDKYFDTGGILLKSKNNFEYIDFHGNKRIRKNAFYKGGDFYIKYKSENIKFINYFIINEKGTPGSAQFERTEATTANLQNLAGISYNKEFNNFNIELKFSENHKNYNFTDNKPPVFGLKKIEYNLKSNTVSSSADIGFEINEYSFLDIKLANLSYFAESSNQGSKKNIPYIKEYHSFLSIRNESYFFDDSLILKLTGRIYSEQLYQYSLSGIYYINKHFMLKLLTKKGLRIPYLEEKYFQSASVIGNKNLLPETIYKNLISLHLSFSLFNLKTELFYSHLKDNIIFTPISFGLTKAVNTREAIAKGINITADINLKYLKITNILSYNKTIYEETKKDLPQTPELQEKLSVTLKYKKYFLDFNYNYTSKYYNNIFNTDVIPEKHLISVSVKYIFSKNGSNINFKVNNLTNELEYYDSLHIPLSGRAYFACLNLYFL